jgi:site-specific DNA-adenine methylase
VRPFFSFYGSKWRSVPKYPAPKYFRLIEPFAGAASYAVRHHYLDVVLVEKDPIIADLWRFLIRASKQDILNIPLLETGQTVQELDCSSDAKSLVGFWVNKAPASPCNFQSSWMRSGKFQDCFWGSKIRSRVAEQVQFIKHWTVIEGDYSQSPTNEIATFFVDPPYQKAGSHYRVSSKKLDFNILGHWCKKLNGQIIVCEQQGATWLPFEPFLDVKSMSGKSKEAVWISERV